MIHYGGQRPEGWRPPVQGVTDADILRQNHRFIRSEADDAVSTWERRLAKKYYDKCARPLPPPPAWPLHLPRSRYATVVSGPW